RAEMFPTGLGAVVQLATLSCACKCLNGRPGELVSVRTPAYEYTWVTVGLPGSDSVKEKFWFARGGKSPQTSSTVACVPRAIDLSLLSSNTVNVSQLWFVH